MYSFIPFMNLFERLKAFQTYLKDLNQTELRDLNKLIEDKESLNNEDWLKWFTQKFIKE